MSSIHLSWRELSGELPMVCATCGADAVELVERPLSSVRPGLLCIVRTRTNVILPACARHRVASWNGFMRERARSIGSAGVTLGQVAPGFVEAVEDYRDQRERQRRGLPVVLRPADEDDDDGDEERRPRVTSESSRAWYAIIMVLIVTVVVSGCGFGLLAINLMRARPAPGPQPPVFNHPGQPVVPKPPLKRFP